MPRIEDFYDEATRERYAKIDKTVDIESIARFDTYEPKVVIGEKIYNSFIEYFVENKGFPLKESKEEKIGIISNCMALSSFLEFDAMGVDITKTLDQFYFVLKNVFDSIYKHSKVIFDASPYLNDEGSITTYIETASKVLITMLDLRDYAYKYMHKKKFLYHPIVLIGKKITEFSQLFSLAEKLIIDSMRVIVDACLPVKEKMFFMVRGKEINRKNLSNEITYRGWAFQLDQEHSDDYDVSLYYSYHATNAFISFYRKMPQLFENEILRQTDCAQADINEQKYLASLNYESKERYQLDKKFFQNNQELIENYRIRVACTGRYIDKAILENKINIAFDFVKSDFTSITTNEILKSQKNNYVIDTLFVLAILVNAGVDEDYILAGLENHFYSQLQYSLNNIKKIYFVLKNQKKEDLIDSYRLSNALFNEKYPQTHAILVQKLRDECENIAVYDLVPLLCNTYSIISDFLIKYPQKEMIDNLNLIMENISLDNKWYWTKKGFDINNNLYYIVALENFYEYHENYELPFLEEHRLYELESKTAELIKLENEKQALVVEHNKEIEKLKNLYEDKQSSLDKEVYIIAEKLFESKIETAITDYFSSRIKQCYNYARKLANVYQFSEENVERIFEEHPELEILVDISNVDKILTLYNDENVMDAYSKTAEHEAKMIRNRKYCEMLNNRRKN